MTQQRSDDDNTISKPPQPPKVKEGKAKLRWLNQDFSLEGEVTKMEWLVEGLIPERGYGFIAGLPKSGKTWLAQALMLCALNGTPWCGRRTKQIDRNVVYVAGEGSMESLIMRTRALVRGYNMDPKTWKAQFSILQHFTPVFEEPEDFEGFAKRIAAKKPGLLILDSLTRLHSFEENSRTEMEKFVLTPLMQLTEYLKCCTVVVHHSKDPMKSGKMSHFDPLRGSQALRGWHEFLIWLEPMGEGDKPRGLLKSEMRDAPAIRPQIVTLNINDDVDPKTATIDMSEPPDIGLLISNVEEGMREESLERHLKSSDVEEKVLGAFDSELVTVRSLHEATGMRKTTVQGALDRLVSKGIVAKHSYGNQGWFRYSIKPIEPPLEKLDDAIESLHLSDGLNEGYTEDPPENDEDDWN